MSNTSDIKQINLFSIIKIIRIHGPVTKPEIVKLSNLTSVTVHNYIIELVEKKLIIEDGSAESNGGRKAILYKTNPKFGYVISQNLGTDYIQTSIFDMDLTLLYDNTLYCPMNYSDKIVNVMCLEIKSGIQKLNISNKDCLGIGLSVPGQTDHDKGVIMNLPALRGWNRIPIKAVIEKEIGITTFLDNDNNSNALAAKWMNVIKDDVDAVFISITSGVGMGILTKGKLFYGSHSSVGELGHTTIQYDGPKCTCGNNGCLEALVSDFVIVDKVRSCKKNTASIKNDDIVNIKAVINMAKQGDDEVYNILKKTTEFIVIAIDHIIKLYGPDVIIIESNWLKEFKDLFFYIIDQVFLRCAWVEREDVNIMLNPVENIRHIGAATLVFENIFNDSPENPFLKSLGLQ